MPPGWRKRIPVLLDFEFTADAAEDVEEGDELGLGGAFDEDVSPGGQRGRGPGGGLIAVGQRPVDEAAQGVHAFDAHDPVGVDGDDGAHLLQQGDEVHDLGFDGRIAQFGHAFGADRGQQHLLGGTHGGEGQFDLRALEAPTGGEHDAAGGLVDLGAELAQHVEVEVDGTIPDVAAAQIGNERLAQAVQEGSAEEDRDPRGTGVRVDVDDRSLCHIGGVEVQLTVGEVSIAAGRDPNPVELEQTGDDLDVPDLRHPAQHGGRLPQQRCDHGLGHQVLGASDLDCST